MGLGGTSLFLLLLPTYATNCLVFYFSHAPVDELAIVTSPQA